MSMNIKRAVAKVAENNPRAVWYAVEFFKNDPDVFEIFDFTFSDEVRSRIGSYDCCTETLFDSDGTEWPDNSKEESARFASAMTYGIK